MGDDNPTTQALGPQIDYGAGALLQILVPHFQVHHLVDICRLFQAMEVFRQAEFLVV